MPRVELPHTFKGWLVAWIAALAGLLAGFLTIRIIGGIGG